MTEFLRSKERVRNAVEIDIFGTFGHVFINTNFPPLPPLKNYSGAVALLFFILSALLSRIYPCGNRKFIHCAD